MTDDVLKRLERRVRAARDRVGRTANPSFGSAAHKNLRELRALRQLIEELYDEEILRGRAEGGSWASLGTSKQQAQQRHAAALKRKAERGLTPSQWRRSQQSRDSG